MENTLINPVLEKARKVKETVKSNYAGKTPDNLVHYANEPESVIRQRIEALDKEWDMNRMLQLNASVLTIAGVALGTRVNKNWFLLPGIVAVFLGVHAVKGWCPPVPLLKAAGVRTRQEIDKEKYGLLEIIKLRKRNSQ
jgi:hypothetical protein